MLYKAGMCSTANGKERACTGNTVKLSNCGKTVRKNRRQEKWRGGKSGDGSLSSLVVQVAQFPPPVKRTLLGEERLGQ